MPNLQLPSKAENHAFPKAWGYKLSLKEAFGQNATFQKAALGGNQTPKYLLLAQMLPLLSAAAMVQVSRLGLLHKWLDAACKKVLCPDVIPND